MNKKHYIIIGVVVVILLAIISYEETITVIDERGGKSSYHKDKYGDKEAKMIEKEGVEIVRNFIEELYNNKNYDALDVVDENIKQHDPLIDDGVEGLRNALKETWFSGFPEYYVDIKRIIADDNLVFVQSHVTTNAEDRGNDFAEDSFALGSIYLLEKQRDGIKIAEHWSITQPVPTTSINGNSMFDGGQFEKESKRMEEKNEKIVLRYMLEALNDRDVDVLDEILAEDWIAHNPTEQNGRENLKDLFQNVFFAQFPELYADVKRVGTQGNLVFVHTHYTVSKEEVGNDFTGAANIDIFRLEDGIIVEHWDVVMRPVPEATVSGRSMFDGGALYNYKKDGRKKGKYSKDKRDEKGRYGDKKKDGYGKDKDGKDRYGEKDKRSDSDRRY